MMTVNGGEWRRSCCCCWWWWWWRWWWWWQWQLYSCPPNQTPASEFPSRWSKSSEEGRRSRPDHVIGDWPKKCNHGKASWAEPMEYHVHHCPSICNLLHRSTNQRTSASPAMPCFHKWDADHRVEHCYSHAIVVEVCSPGSLRLSISYHHLQDGNGWIRHETHLNLWTNINKQSVPLQKKEDPYMTNLPTTRFFGDPWCHKTKREIKLGLPAILWDSNSTVPIQF